MWKAICSSPWQCCVHQVAHTSLPATHCNTLQHTTAHCNTLQSTPQHLNMLTLLTRHFLLRSLRSSTFALQHTATHCYTHGNTLNYVEIAHTAHGPCFRLHTRPILIGYIHITPAPYKRTDQPFLKRRGSLTVLQCVCNVLQGVALCCSVLQCAAVCCSALQCVVSGKARRRPNGITLQHPATPCNTLQHPATPCNTLQHLVTPYITTLQYTTQLSGTGDWKTSTLPSIKV